MDLRLELEYASPSPPTPLTSQIPPPASTSPTLPTESASSVESAPSIKSAPSIRSALHATVLPACEIPTPRCNIITSAPPNAAPTIFSNKRRFASRACVSFLVAISVFSIISDIVYSSMQDALHITALLGQSVVFNCPVEFPNDHVVPYVMQWEKKVRDMGTEIPIYIWYESYPTHNGDGYEGRVSRVAPDSPYGLASLNLTDIRESDQGWYVCKVQFLNRPPSTRNKNGTWFYLDVHAPPRFVVTPEEVIYVTIGDAIILNCQAEGTPSPEIIWFKDNQVVDPSLSIGVFNDGTELRISNIRRDDIGDYTCIARNGEGRISHTARVVIAGGAVIVAPPTNQTKLEGEQLEFPCGAKALPGNVTIQWTKDGMQLNDIGGLEARINHKRDGTLVISPVSSDDSGQYTCEVGNGIGQPQSASAYLNVEYPAKVTYTPTVQYLPFRLGGVVQCYIKSNPPLQYVTWTKDKRLLEPYQTKDIVIMNNGSLFFTRVNQNHQGRYTCTPYNAQGTQGSSGDMEVLVKKPPFFLIQPNNTYHKKVGDSVDMHCDAQDGESTQKPKIEWRRKDGHPIKKDRVRITEGNLTIDSLRRTDFGYYQCVIQNEVATIISDTQLVMEGTQPHAPYNLTIDVSETEVTIHWLPGYSGGPDYKQEYVVWFRESGVSDWNRISVDPPSATSFLLTGLKPSTAYEFQIVGKNALGDGMLSKIMVAKTLDPGSSQLQRPTTSTIFQSPSSDDVLDCSNIIFATDFTGATIYPSFKRFKGPRPGPPRNVTVTEVDNGFVISWEAPQERPDLVKYYTIMYRTDNQWKDVTKNSKIRADETKYLVKNMVGGRTYFFRVIAHGNRTYESSEQVKYSVPARVKQKAITAGVVGGILFFIVAIILSICAVKICNKRKRRKQEKAYNIVACRITDARNGGQIPPVRQIPLNKSENNSCTDQILNMLLKCLGSPHHNCIVVRDIRDGDGLGYNTDSMKRVRTISRAPDGRFILTTSSRSSSISSSIDDGGFLTHPAFRHLISPTLIQPTNINVASDLSFKSGESMGSHDLGTVRTPQHPAPVIYSNTPFLSSSPTSTVLSPFLSPVYFSDLSSVQQPSSGERTLRSIHAQYSQELPSLKAIHEENERILSSYSPKPSIPKHSKLPPRHARYSHSAPELAHITPEMSPESHSSSSGVASKNTSQQTGSSVTGEWRPPVYKSPPMPVGGHTAKPPYIRTWLDYTPSPTQSVSSNKPISVDGHYEFDAIFPASPTPTEMVLTPLPPVRTRPPSRSRVTKQEYIEARVQAMKEEFYEYRKRQAQMRRIKELESVC